MLTGMLHEMCASFKAMPQKSEVRLKQERTAHLAVSCVAKTFLQRLPALTNASDPVAFANAWFATLDALRLTGEAATCEELRPPEHCAAAHQDCSQAQCCDDPGFTCFQRDRITHEARCMRGCSQLDPGT